LLSPSHSFFSLTSSSNRKEENQNTKGKGYKIVSLSVGFDIFFMLSIEFRGQPQDNRATTSLLLTPETHCSLKDYPDIFSQNCLRYPDEAEKFFLLLPSTGFWKGRKPE